jgi:hypothetical protein
MRTVPEALGGITRLESRRTKRFSDGGVGHQRESAGQQVADPDRAIPLDFQKMCLGPESV